MKVEKEKLRALMQFLEKVAKLNKYLENVLFCIMLFEKKLCRDYFKSLRSDVKNLKFVDDKY